MTTFTQRRATVEAFVDCMRGGADKGVSTVAADLTYKEVLSGETHHAAFFGCRSKTRRSTEWTTSSSTRTARLPR